MADPKGKTPSERIKMQHQHGRKVMGMRDKQKSGGSGGGGGKDDNCVVLPLFMSGLLAIIEGVKYFN